MENRIYTIAVGKEHSAVDVLMALRNVASTFGPVKVVTRKNLQALQLDPYENNLTRMFLFASENSSSEQTIVELSCDADIKGFSVAGLALLALAFIWTIVGPILFIAAVVGAYATAPGIMEKISRETERRIISPESSTHGPLKWPDSATQGPHSRSPLKWRHYS